MTVNPDSTVIKGYHKSKVMLKVVGIVVFAVTTFLLCLFISTSIAQSQSAGFTIAIEPKEKGGAEYCSVSLSETPGFENPTTGLFPEGISEITNISGNSILDEVDNYDGSHNGKNYLAYSFYIKNTGNIDGYINESFEVLSSLGGVADSIRVKIYRNGISETYAALAKDGSPEYGTTPFVSKDKVTDYTVEYSVEQATRYTIVIWLEGDDPECTEDIRGGEIKFTLTFKVVDESGSEGTEDVTE